MKRILFFLFFMTSVWSVVAARLPQPSEVLEQLAARFRSLGSYRVAFEVRTVDGVFPGYYAVAGDRYYLVLGDAEVYGDDSVRYEVDHARREVVVDRVDTSSRSLLNNPVRAFDFVDDEFSAELLDSADGLVTVRLTPRERNAAISAIDITVESSTGQPRSVSYLFDGERITIAVRSVAAEKTPPAPFDKANYADFEQIDFR